MMNSNIAIFASGSGTNAENIIKYFLNDKKIKVVSVLSNKKDAFVLERAKRYNVPIKIFDKNTFYSSFEILDYLKKKNINWIVLAGFLWLIPEYLIEAFENRIINIHPALLPKYGGKGMYGMKVHKTVIDNNEPESGITIHIVNKEYDKGEIVFQAKCPVIKGDTPESLAQRIHKLEYEHFPKVIEQLILKDS